MVISFSEIQEMEYLIIFQKGQNVFRLLQQKESVCLQKSDTSKASLVQLACENNAVQI